MVNMLHVQNITLALINAAMSKHTIGSDVVSEVVHEGREDAELPIHEHNAYLSKIAEWCKANHLPPLTSLICRDGIAAPGFWLAYPELKVPEDKKTIAQAMTTYFHNQCFEFFDGVGVANNALMQNIEERIAAIRLFAERHHEPLPLTALVRYCESIGAVGVDGKTKLDIPALQRPAISDWLDSYIVFDNGGRVTGWDTHAIQSDEDRNTIVRSGIVPVGKAIDVIGILFHDVAGNNALEFRQLEVKGLLFEDNIARPGTYNTTYTGVTAIGGGQRGWLYKVVEQVYPKTPHSRDTVSVAEATFDPERGILHANTSLIGITSLIVELRVLVVPFSEMQ